MNIMINDFLVHAVYLQILEGNTKIKFVSLLFVTFSYCGKCTCKNYCKGIDLDDEVDEVEYVIFLFHVLIKLVCFLHIK